MGRAAGRTWAKPGAVLFLLCCSVAFPACVRMTIRGMRGPTGPASEALLTVDGQSYPISACLSGDRAYFLGVDLIDQTRGPVLRVVIDPLDGPRLMLLREGRASEVLGREQCSELHAVVQPTGWRVNHVRDVEGEVEARCTLSAGGRLNASVRFRHCH